MTCSAQPAAACSASHPSARQPPARALRQPHVSLLPLAASRPTRQCPTFPSFLLRVLSFLASVNGARPKRPNTASRRRLCACKASAQITALRFPSIHRACTPIKPELDALPPPFLCSPSQSPLPPANSPSRALNLDADVTLSSALFHGDRRCLPFLVLVTIRSNFVSPAPSSLSSHHRRRRPALRSLPGRCAPLRTTHGELLRPLVPSIRCLAR